MIDASVTKQTAIDNIVSKLPELLEDELKHISHVIDSFMEPKDHSMHYLGRFLGISKVDEGFVMELGKQNENIYGVAQGGSIYTLADVSIGFFILDKIATGKKVFTQELKMNFIKKGKGNFLYATPKVLHWGRKTVIADCSIKDENNQLVAQGLGTFYIVATS
ncbi:PaaI family thioesterase [Virgibacillus sp. DJP39]|uniref:PaaI family thioesterase n=1 Tax=Virgibacillus sp. DJP39 TaxID=3409790 RepID=UPI003BB50F07